MKASTTEQFPPGRVEVEPAGAVDLGELGGPTGARRPFHLERVARGRGDVEVALERPCPDQLAAGLAQLAEVHGSVRIGRVRPSSSANSRIATSSGSSPSSYSGHRPRALVLLGPVRPAGVHEQDLRLVPHPAVHQQARASFGHPAASVHSAMEDLADGVDGVGVRRRLVVPVALQPCEPQRDYTGVSGASLQPVERDLYDELRPYEDGDASRCVSMRCSCSISTRASRRSCL